MADEQQQGPQQPAWRAWLSTARHHPSPATDRVGVTASVISAIAFVLGKAHVITLDVVNDLSGYMAVGALVLAGAWRLVRAPFWVIERRDTTIQNLKNLLADAEAGPEFLLEIRNPHVFTRTSASQDMSNPYTMVYLAIKLTNTGPPGGAEEWRAYFEFDEKTFTAVPMPALSLVVGDPVTGKELSEIAPDGNIVERTAKLIATGEPIYGVFIGVMPIEAYPLLDGGYRVIVTCRNHAKKWFAARYMASSGTRDEPKAAVINLPTMKPIVLPPTPSQPLLNEPKND